MPLVAALPRCAHERAAPPRFDDVSFDAFADVDAD